MVLTFNVRIYLHNKRIKKGWIKILYTFMKHSILHKNKKKS